jgi:hypothetical protein
LTSPLVVLPDCPVLAICLLQKSVLVRDGDLSRYQALTTKAITASHCLATATAEP